MCEWKFDLLKARRDKTKKKKILLSLCCGAQLFALGESVL